MTQYPPPPLSSSIQYLPPRPTPQSSQKSMSSLSHNDRGIIRISFPASDLRQRTEYPLGYIVEIGARVR